MTSPEPPAQPTQPVSPPPGFQPPPQFGPPQQYGPPPPYRPPAAPQRRMPIWLIILICVGAVAFSVCIGGTYLFGNAFSNIPGIGGSSAEKDVTIDTCDIGVLGPEAHLSVVNSGSSRANYLITVAFESSDGGTQYGTGTAAVNDLEPGQTGSADATSFKTDVAAGTDLTCKVTGVTRL